MPSADPAPQSLVASIESTRDLRRRLYRTAWPVILENLLQSATFMINTALAGRLGAAALSAAGISNFLLFFGFTLFLGLGVGMLAQVARAVGARDRAGAQRVAWHGLALGTALSGASTLVLVLFAVGNWETIATPTRLNLLVGQVQMPLGLLMLIATGVVTVLYALLLVVAERRLLREGARLHR